MIFVSIGASRPWIIHFAARVEMALKRCSANELQMDVKSENEQMPTVCRSRHRTFGACIVCEAPAYCFHFGVLSCNACAAFFRRYVTLRRSYRCQYGGNCIIAVDGNLNGAWILCRACRYKKCIQVGMEAALVQTGGNATNASQCKDAKSVQPILELHPETRTASTPPSDPETKGNYDYPSLFRCFLERCSKPPKVLPPELGLLHRIVAGVRSIRRNQSAKPTILEEMGRENTQQCFEWCAFSASEWLMNIPEFVALDPNDKLTMFKLTHFCVGRLERFHMTVAVYKREIAEEGRALYMHDGHVTEDFDRTKHDISFFSDFDWERIRGYFQGIRTRLMKEIALPMLHLLVTEIELAFMLCHAAWHLEGREGVGESLAALSRRMRERAANELHAYYVEEADRLKYAERLMRLLRIVADMESISIERNSIFELSSLFDVMRVRMDETQADLSDKPSTGSCLRK